MTRTVTPDKFAIALDEILREYSKEVSEKVEPCVRKAVNAGRKETMARAPRNPNIKLRKGPYYTGFATKVRRVSDTEVEGVVYNRKYPGLVHLLEKGHATLGGGRVDGREHVAWDTTNRVLEDAVKKAIGE